MKGYLEVKICLYASLLFRFSATGSCKSRDIVIAHAIFFLVTGFFRVTMLRFVIKATESKFSIAIRFNLLH